MGEKALFSKLLIPLPATICAGSPVYALKICRFRANRRNIVSRIYLSGDQKRIGCSVRGRRVRQD